MGQVVNELYSEIGQFDFDSLVAGSEMPILQVGVTLAPGNGVLARGTLLGIVTASGLAAPCKSSASDGSQTPLYILEKDTDTGESGATDSVSAIAYQSGLFNRAAVVVQSGDSIDQFADALRTRNIILTGTVAYPTVSVDSITVAPAVVTLSLAGTKTAQLAVAFQPANASDQGVIYASDNTAVATVSASGLVTGVAAGAANITATSHDGSNTAVCAVTVTA